MKEPSKLTEQEVVEIKKLQEKFQNQIYKFGHLTIRRIKTEQTLKQINEKETLLVKELENLEGEENKLIENFLSKYGEGRLDLSTGTFVPETTDSSTT